MTEPRRLASDHPVGAMARMGRSPTLHPTMLTFLLSAAIFAACMRLGWILMDRLDGR